MSKPARNLSRRCEWCAGARVVRRVAVVPLRPDVPEVDTLALCAGCRESPWRTTWRRYRRAVGAPGAELALGGPKLSAY